FAFRVDRTRELVSTIEPLCHGAAKWLDAFVRRVAAKIRNMSGERRSDKGRDRMLWLADRHIDRGLTRLDVGDQFGQPHEGRARVDRRSSMRVGLALGDHHGHAVTEGARNGSQYTLRTIDKAGLRPR